MSILITMSFSVAEVLEDIKINGNKRISKETIIVLGKIEVNADYNDNELNNVLKNLYNSNFFKEIDLSLSNGLLTINLT